jgi:hypothetical protein
LERVVNYPRRQQYRRVGRAATTGAGAVVLVALALIAASLGALWLALVLLLSAVALGAYARHWARLAGRSRVGARSEEQVQRTLAPLAAEGWRLRHSLRWQGRGDIDSVAIAPTGIAFARPRPERSTASTSRVCMRWPCGCMPAAGAGVQQALSRSYAWFTHAGSTGSKRTF